MPRFFFDIADVPDKVEADLPDREAARAYAIGLAETILQGKTREAETGQSSIEIRNDADEVLDTIKSQRS